MPGTTRYSATFDRTYEEEADDDVPTQGPVTRRSRSQSWQAQTLTESQRYRPLSALQRPRSPSADKGQTVPKGIEAIPTRTAGKATVKAHNNPFQFVKVNTAPLHRKAEEQLKKLQEIKKPPVVKEDEEEWQSNLDSWKSRRRKMSETAFRRQEELRQLEMEGEPLTECSQQKKTKTFSEMIEQRAHRGRAVSLCLFSNPMESSEWIFEASKSRSSRMRSHDPLSGESAESSTMNSEDDNDCFMKHEDEEDNKNHHNVNSNSKPHLSNGHTNNSVTNSASNSSISKASELSEFEASQNGMPFKERSSNGGYIDSGLESLSSSHRTGDIPDSGSDFSHDSGSSLDCDSPRVSGLITTGIELLEEFSSKGEELFNSSSTICQKQKSPLDELVASPIKDKTQLTTPSATVKEDDTNADATKVKTKKVTKKVTKSSKVKNAKPTQNGAEQNSNSSNVSSPSTKSVESENEMYVDDFDELAKLKNLKDSKNEKNKEEKQITGSTKVFRDPSKTSLNVIYKSESEAKSSPSQISPNSKPTNNSSSNNSFSLIGEVPVEKITEEMERLILEQLEEEEKSKEISSGVKSKGFDGGDEKNDLVAPPKHVEPPKEKPPPPPQSSPPNDSQKGTALKRVNSTKRIIKEIHKRRSDFLGIDKANEETTCNEAVVPPPPVLEDLLRAEREQDRLRRQMLNTKASTESLVEEDEIARKEREIIENLETEERLRLKQEPQLTGTKIDIRNEEEQRISKLKEERKRIEEERLVAEEQKARLEEARLLQRREEYIRKQEADTVTGSSPAALSLDAPTTTTNSVTADASVSSLPQNGDGLNNKASSSSSTSLVVEASKTKEAPPTPPKPPLKKKEAIRKERERLRQEQEALQREREEHRLKIQLEQEQLKKTAQNSHVPDVPRVAPPIPAKPTQQPQLTNTSHISQAQLRDDSYNSQSHGGRDQNGNQAVGAQGLPTNRPARNAVARTKAKVQQKVPCVRKQTEASSESRYNQNHWLIQEAEMRRIAEQKERQRNLGQMDARYISASQVTYHQPPFTEDYHPSAAQRPSNLPIAQNTNVNSSNYAVPAQLHSPDQHWTYLPRNGMPTPIDLVSYPRPYDPNMTGPIKPTKGVLLEKQEQMLSVSGRKRCSHCGEELGRGAAMIIESLQLYYHIQCFQCCVCQAQLGNGSCGTDVRVRNNKLHCHNCYSNDEAGLKFSQV